MLPHGTWFPPGGGSSLWKKELGALLTVRRYGVSHSRGPGVVTHFWQTGDRPINVTLRTTIAMFNTPYTSEYVWNFWNKAGSFNPPIKGTN